MALTSTTVSGFLFLNFHEGMDDLWPMNLAMTGESFSIR